jgi:photosynthetic reaction center cytochrome c subunit
MRTRVTRVVCVAVSVGTWLGAVTFAADGLPYPQHPSAPTAPLLAPRVLMRAGNQAQATTKPQMAEEAYKNIQVLKGIPVDEFLGTMGIIAVSLGMDCTACHTGAGTSNPKWEDDPPRKQMARLMIRMVQNINRTSFGGRQVVTCFSCHRGQYTPPVTTPLDFAYGAVDLIPPDVLPQATSGAPSLDQVFDRFVQAAGGAARTGAITSYIAKGRGLLFGEVGDGEPAEIYARAPNQIAQLIHLREGMVARTFDGSTAWFQLPLTVTPQYQLNATLAEGARFEAAMAFPWRIRSFFTNWRTSYPTFIEGTEVDVVQGSTAAGMIGTLYFDKQTGLLKRSVRYANTVIGRMPTQIDYSDYRPVAGVMMPFKFNYSWVSQREEWTLTEYQTNVTIDATRFGKP